MNQLPESARRRLQAQAVGEHPDADLLTAFAEQSLGNAERERVLAHLAACAACREVVSLAMPHEPEVVEVAAPVAGGWFRWPVLRWTAMAATVIVVGAAVSVLVRRDREVEVIVPAHETSAPAAEQRRESQPVPAGNVAPSDRDKASRKSLQAAQEPKQQTPVLPNPQGSVSSVLTENSNKEAAGSTREEQPVAKNGTVGKLDTDTDKNFDAVRKDAPSGRSFQKIEPGVVGGVLGGAAPKSEKKVMADEAAVAPPPPPPPPQSQPVPQRAQDQAASAKPAAPTPAATAQNESVSLLRQAPAAGQTAAATGAAVGGPVMLSKAKAVSPARWRVSSAGAVERSTDGRVWEKVEIDPGVTFRAMSSNAGDLWAGGTAGSLFHSADAGRTWSRVKVGDDGMWVTDTITAVEFPSTRSGFVTTQGGAVWMTQDGGRTWQRRQ